MTDVEMDSIIHEKSNTQGDTRPKSKCANQTTEMNLQKANS